MIINKEKTKPVESEKEYYFQQVLRKNLRKNYCCETLNNLGVFYWINGMYLNDGRVIKAEKLAVRYLEQAALKETNYNNYVSLASVYSELQQYSKAYEIYSKAFLLKKDSVVAYNRAACLYRLKEYKYAVDVLNQVNFENNINAIIDNNGQHPFILMAYCEYELGNLAACAEHIINYRNDFSKDELHDVFVLRFLCGRYDEALSECKELLQEWYATDYLCAMIAECICQISDFDMITKIEDYSIIEKIYVLINNKKLRQIHIDEYKYVPPVVELYLYI